MCICIFGIIFSYLLEENYNNVYKEIVGKRTIEAIVISEPENKDYKFRYTIEIQDIVGNEKSSSIGKKIILDVKIKNQKYIPKFGDKIILKGEVKIPNTSRNYKGFDYRQYLKTKNIYGIVESEQINKIEEDCINIVSKIVNNVQNNIKNTMNQILNDNEASLCIGILIGDRTNISEEIENDFKKSNLTHMLAVSGSHIAYIINGFALILGKTNKKLAKITTIIFLIFFIILTGFTASVLRASFMGILVLLASLLYRKPDTLNNLGISSLLILLINPYTIFDIGFILSFAGTLGIVLFADSIINYIFLILEKKLKVKESKVFKYLVTSFSITLSANLLIIPIMAYSFSTFSFTFLISNILAGPVMEIVTIFGFMVYLISIICMPLVSFLGLFLNFLLFILIKIAEISSMFPGSSMYIKTPYLFSCICYYTIILIYCLRNEFSDSYKEKLKNILKFHKNIISFILIIILIINLIFRFIISSNLKIYFIDVGQGDSTLVKTPFNKNILIDGGGSEFGNFDVGESILLPYLLDRRINKIDYLVISHFDSDHVKGLFSVLKNLRVDNIVISKQGENSSNFKEFENIIKDKKIKLRVVKQGDRIKIDKLTYINILFPEEKLISDNILNNNSIVFKLISNNFSMLFTGDIEEIAEERIYEIYKSTDILKSDVLKVAHHGSKTSSTSDFLSLVNPKITLIGVGKDNNFGHPDEATINQLKLYTKNICRTDEKGEIILEYNGKKLKIKNHVQT